MTYGIGANDAANSWGTSVARAASSPAVLLGVCEWLGAVGLGYGVSKTIWTSKTDDARCWACGYCDSEMSLYMVAMRQPGGGCFFDARHLHPHARVDAQHRGGTAPPPWAWGSAASTGTGTPAASAIIASWVISPVSPESS